jgi:hypothetical protein
MLCLLNLPMLAIQMFHKFPMTSRIILCIRVFGFEAFGSRTLFMQAGLSQLASRASELAMASKTAEPGVLLAPSSPREQCSSPRRVMLLASRARQCLRHCLLVSGLVVVLRAGVTRAVFLKINPSNQDSIG